VIENVDSVAVTGNKRRFIPDEYFELKTKIFIGNNNQKLILMKIHL